jgi:YHS domain-containing protein
MKRDPVCGMEVDEKDAPARTTYKGEMFYFCSEDCRDQFLRNPDAYVAPPATTRTRT